VPNPPQSKQYDYHSLINAYIDTQAQAFIHPDFEQFYRARLVVLEQAFDVKMSLEGAPHNTPLWMLFYATVRYYKRTGHPRDMFLESSLVNSTLDKMGSQGAEIYQLDIELRSVIEQAHSVYQSLLVRLFIAMYGEHPQIFTSDDLKQLGFDDSTEPNTSDYYDYM
jgi:hypothetical protein